MQNRGAGTNSAGPIKRAKWDRLGAVTAQVTRWNV